jgi:hypothetical protein
MTRTTVPRNIVHRTTRARMEEAKRAIPRKMNPGNMVTKEEKRARVGSVEI